MVAEVRRYVANAQPAFGIGVVRELESHRSEPLTERAAKLAVPVEQGVRAELRIEVRVQEQIRVDRPA